MTEETLRRWVRGQLPPAERREVSRWMLRCTDPELPELLQALTREARDEAQDADLIAAGREALVRAWRALLAAGQAGLSVGEAPALVLAGVGPGAPPPLLSLRVEGDRLRLDLHLPEAAEVALWASRDLGPPQALLSPRPLASGPHANRVSIDASADRLTLWLLRGAGLPETLEEALEAPGVEVTALRWLPE